MNFALILFLLSLATGVIWFIDRLYLAKSRPADKAAPAWVEYTGGFFPVIITVFMLRSFVFEPFRIPSGSMIPTLLVGDLILVNKYAYGIRLPVINMKVLELGQPQRGDVMVFRPPHEPDKDYIKRVIGLPGDEVVYQDKRLTVNGESFQVRSVEDFYDADRMAVTRQFDETVGSVHHNILNDDRMGNWASPMNFQFRDQCTYNDRGFRCKVPAGHYFMMGDNRDNSADSRVWGFVPDRNIVGKAFFIWMNFGSLSRIGSFH
jgi:signal peptidase I